MRDHTHPSAWLLCGALAVLILITGWTFAGEAEAATASCFGPGLVGNLMANGQTLNRGTVGVAHKTLPLWNPRTRTGTRLYVRSNGRTVLVPVTDRGPYVSGRSLDLTQAAVWQLGYGGCTAFGHRSVRAWRA